MTRKRKPAKPKQRKPAKGAAPSVTTAIFPDDQLAAHIRDKFPGPVAVENLNGAVLTGDQYAAYVCEKIADARDTTHRERAAFEAGRRRPRKEATRAKLAKRDLEIRKAWRRNGGDLTVPELSDVYQLSEPRIRQILKPKGD